MRLWDTATTTRQSDARVMWNAANFYRAIDQRRYVAALEKAVALAPFSRYTPELGNLYANALLTTGRQSDLAPRARQVLETTTNALLLEASVRSLQSHYNRSLMMGKENAALGELARRYFLRAKMLDPDLNQDWVYPKLDARPAAPSQDLQARFDAAAKKIRRVSPDAFPELPARIAAMLRSRGCTIPQPDPSGPLRNVIHGKFFARGQEGWAALCSRGEFSSILVFRDVADADPDELARMEDRNYVQILSEDNIGFSREITAVDREFIMRHYRAYGGPQPPPIDHQGIDDAFLEKGSVTYYWYQGKWLRLRGAD